MFLLAIVDKVNMNYSDLFLIFSVRRTFLFILEKVSEITFVFKLDKTIRSSVFSKVVLFKYSISIAFGLSYSGI